MDYRVPFRHIGVIDYSSGINRLYSTKQGVIQYNTGGYKYDTGGYTVQYRGL